MPENHNKYQERLVKLRNEIKKHGLDGFISLRTDEFQGEFLAPYAERLSWLTGFTGSAGAAVILQKKAVVLSDGRYTIQLKNQVDSSLYLTEDITQISTGQWLSEHAKAGDKIGYDMWLYTRKQIDNIREKAGDIKLIPMDFNLIDNIWTDQPAKPSSAITIFPDEVAGRSSREKRASIAKDIKTKDCKACLITLSDSICWLLNVRGGDIDYSPLVLSYALLYANGSLDWFINRAVNISMSDNVRIFPMDEMAARIKQIEGRIWLDSSCAPLWFENLGIDIFDSEDPCILPKSIKSKPEQEAIRQAHIHDGVAMVKFLKWLDETDEPLSELSVEVKLDSYRKENPSYKGASFATIAGFADHGAIVHYRADEQSNKSITGNGLLLVDSGGQYEWGTTDITRTIAIGAPSLEMRENYTRVLKGHIALASASFDKGTIGRKIDALARAPLQDAGLDYAHGTGHGVGCYLCVHEIAANISPRGEREFAAGMLISNEPAYYKEGEYGIRIESLVLVQENEGGKLYFETVTLAPFDPKLIITDMLDDREKQWLSQYSKQIYEKLSPFLNDDELTWLRSQEVAPLF